MVWACAVQVKRFAFCAELNVRFIQPLRPAQEVMAGNRAALAVYGGQSMVDPTLAARLAGIKVPTLVLWGEADRIADADYGRAFAAAIPGAEFRLLAKTGHVPQIETPHQLLSALWEFADRHAAARPVR